MKPKSLRMWTNHIHGATALIKARGLAQFETETGRRIFQHLLDYIVRLSCSVTAPWDRQITV